MHCVEVMKYLVRQGLAMRGHDDESGNLEIIEMSCCCCKWSQIMAFQKADLSHDILDEQIKIMADCLLDKMLVKILKAKHFNR